MVSHVFRTFERVRPPTGLVVRTVRTRATSVRVSSFLRDLLVKTTDLVRDTIVTGPHLPSLSLYIYMEGFDRLNMNNRINNQLHLVFTLCIRSSSSLALISLSLPQILHPCSALR
jgi:hypothetical protein